MEICCWCKKEYDGSVENGALSPEDFCSSKCECDSLDDAYYNHEY